MEINKIDIEKPKEMVWSSSSDGYELGQADNRSFICTFCKRGFSNAQALGGHMNVHRKDRARLRGSFDETQDHNCSTSPDDHNVDHDKNCSHKRPWISSNEDEDSPKRKDWLKEVIQLPLFVETISSSSTYTLETSSDSTVYGHEDKRQPSSSSEVDLELRLGLEPKDDVS